LAGNNGEPGEGSHLAELQGLSATILVFPPTPWLRILLPALKMTQPSVRRDANVCCDSLELLMAYRRDRVANWVVPAVYAAIAVLAGFILPRVERALLPQLESGLHPASAVAIFSTVGTGMIAMTGIVFSLTFLMVQFSATAYSPRLVLWLAREPVLWHSVGVFSATFIYAIAAIAQVDREGAVHTPFVSSWLVIALLLASVGMFIALIEKISLLQIHRMLAFTADHGRRVIEQTYPPLSSRAATADPSEYQKAPITYALSFSGRPQSLQAIDVGKLSALCSYSGGVVVVCSSVGDTLVEGTILLRVHGGRLDVDLRSARVAFVTGDDRTFEQDPKYAIRLLVDIAIKALSPAINDPSTAVQALDQIEDLLRRLGSRRLEIGAGRTPDGVLQLVVPHPSWDDFLTLAFDEIRHCGAHSLQVMRRMKALAADLIRALPPERHESLLHYQKRLDLAIASAFAEAEDQMAASVEDRQGLGAPRANQEPPATDASPSIPR
jgi:uncharacterized membrane protein